MDGLRVVDASVIRCRSGRIIRLQFMRWRKRSRIVFRWMMFGVYLVVLDGFGYHFTQKINSMHQALRAT